MAQPKGSTGNPDGRPKGSKNKTTLQFEALGEAITSTHADRFNNLLKKMKDEDFIKAYIAIIGYFKPKMQSTQLDANINPVHKIEYVNVSKQFPNIE